MKMTIYRRGGPGRGEAEDLVDHVGVNRNGGDQSSLTEIKNRTVEN